jgi:hypothetical protein
MGVGVSIIELLWLGVFWREPLTADESDSPLVLESDFQPFGLNV